MLEVALVLGFIAFAAVIILGRRWCDKLQIRDMEAAQRRLWDDSDEEPADWWKN